jgi:hypothetical protein
MIHLLKVGCSNKQIASRLNLTYGTVKNYMFALMKRFDARSRLQLVLKIEAQESMPVDPPVGQLGTAPANTHGLLATSVLRDYRADAFKRELAAQPGVREPHAHAVDTSAPIVHAGFDRLLAY